MENQRRKNFSFFEAKAFRYCLLGYEDIIESKNTNGLEVHAKMKAWAEITAKYNSIPGVEIRTCQQLRQFYKNQKRRRNLQISNGRIQIFVQKDASPKENAFSNANEENLESVGAMKTLPLVKIFDSGEANHKKKTSETTQSENSSNQELYKESLEIIEVKSADEDEYLKEFDVSEISSLDVRLIPEVPSHESLQPCSRQIQAVSSSTNVLNGINTPDKSVHKINHKTKQFLASDKDDSSSCDVKKQILIEEHEWDCERFNMEKEKGSIEKEKQLLEMKMMKEQLRMYKLINEKIEKGEGIQICVNVNR